MPGLYKDGDYDLSPALRLRRRARYASAAARYPAVTPCWAWPRRAFTPTDFRWSAGIVETTLGFEAQAPFSPVIRWAARC